MENERKATVKDVLIFTKDLLRGIRVPVELKNDVADPIWIAICNIEGCIDAIQRAENGGLTDETENEDIKMEVTEINGEQE